MLTFNISTAHNARTQGMSKYLVGTSLCGGHNLSLWLGLLAWIGLAKVPKYVEDQSSRSHTVQRPCDHVDVAKKMNVSGYNMMKLSKKSCEEINCRERAVVSNFHPAKSKKKTPKWGPLKCSSTLLNKCAHCAWTQANRWWQTWTGTTDIVRYSEELLIHINRPAHTHRFATSTKKTNFSY